jgi:hypothetical protein
MRSLRIRPRDPVQRSPGSEPARRGWTLAALCVFVVAFSGPAGSVWQAGPRAAVLSRSLDVWEDEEGRRSIWYYTTLADVTFITWLVGRNAYTLARTPHRLFDTEHCAPGQRTITLGEPILTLGLLGVPLQLFTEDPILTYNVVVLVLNLLAALAMYLLIAEWTGVPAAGIVASLLYTLHPTQLVHVHHPFARDMAWTLWALFFARRWLAHGRWRDAAGLAVSGSLQLGASFYPVLAAFFLVPPLAVWLLWRHGIRRLRPAQVLLVLGCIAMSAAITYGPYLEARESSDTLRRSLQYFLTWSSYLPGEKEFPGWLVLALAGVALLPLPFSRWRFRLGDPRWALLAGCALVALAAAGGNAASGLLGQRPFPLPNVFAWAAAVLPGLDSVRGISNLVMGVHLALCLLAGLGVAHRAYPIRPDAEALSFFETLERRGNRGPILELPVTEAGEFIAVDPGRILLSGYHHRRTSACFGSYAWQYPVRRQTAELAKRLPETHAIDALTRLGFTTLVVHHEDSPRGNRIRNRLDRAIPASAGRLRLVHATGARSAYAIAP